MTSKKMASKEGEKVVEKTEVDTEDTVDSDKTEGNNGDMQVLDEVLDNDDATGKTPDILWLASSSKLVPM